MRGARFRSLMASLLDYLGMGVQIGPDGSVPDEIDLGPVEEHEEPPSPTKGETKPA